MGCLVLSKQYGEQDTKHLFCGIDDKDIEDNIPTAESTIKTNIDRGLLSSDYKSKLPYLNDGLALSYAAANIGNSRAATRAREAAYTEDIQDLQENLLPELPGITSEKVQDSKNANTSIDSYDWSKVTNMFGEPDDKLKMTKLPGNPNEKWWLKIQPTKYSNFYDDYLKNKTSQNNNNSWNKIGEAFDLPEVNKNPRYVKADVLNMRGAPGINSKIIGTLMNGTEVNYTGNKTKEIDGHLWAEVTYDGKTGWVAADYLKTAKPQNSSVTAASVAPQKPAQSASTNSVNNGSKIDISDYSALQAAFNDVRKPGATDANPGEAGDFDGVWGLQCVDLSNWFLDNYTTLGRVGGDGKDITRNLANEHNLELTTTPTAPAVFSVKEGTYGPGIRTGGVSDEKAGHTGIVLAVKELGDDLYEITYIDTYNGLESNGYNSNINTKTFKKGDNVTYVSLDGHLK